MDHRVVAHAEETPNPRLKHYLALDLQTGSEGSHAAAQSLHKRKLTRGSQARLRHYLRIEKGWTA